MRTKTKKHKSDFICHVTGWHDRICRFVSLDDEGRVISSFLDDRKALYSTETLAAVNAAQQELREARAKADEVIAQISEEHFILAAKDPVDIYEERRWRHAIGLFVTLIAIRNQLKAAYVKLHAVLDASQTEIKRQLTAYLLAAFSRKSEVNISKNAAVNYQGMTAYQAYVNSYEQADRAIHAVVDQIVGIEALCQYLKGVMQNEESV